MTLPLTVDDITPAWLGDALGTAIESVTVESIVWGTATKVLIDADRRPLCVKGGFVEELRPVMGIGYITEAYFYRDLAPLLGDGQPTAHFADADPTLDQGIVIMDDLRAAGVTFADARDPMTVDQVGEALEIQARWHALETPRLDWLEQPPHIRAMIRGLFVPEHWDAYIGQAETDLLADRDRIARAFEAGWALEDAAPRCLVHGDANLTNVYFDGGHPRFTDWQFAGLGDWAMDVALFVVGALSTQDRRAYEESLLRGYLTARGAGAPDFDTAWDAYRRHHLHGAMYTLTPEEMQPATVRIPLAARYVAAAVDHGTLHLLEQDQA